MGTPHADRVPTRPCFRSDFKSPNNASVKSDVCIPTWRRILERAGVVYEERAADLRTQKQSKCALLPDYQTKTYRDVFSSERGSVLHYIVSCASTYNAMDVWQTRTPYDVLARMVVTGQDRLISQQPMDYRPVRVALRSRRPVKVAYCEIDTATREPMRFVTIQEGTFFEWETVASTVVFAAFGPDKQWHGCRAFCDSDLELTDKVVTDIVTDTETPHYVFGVRSGNRPGKELLVERLL